MACLCVFFYIHIKINKKIDNLAIIFFYKMNIKKLIKIKINMATQHFIPTVSWYQTDRNVYLEFLLSDTKNVIVDYETDAEKGECSTLLFEADVNQKHYLLCVELFATIVEEESTHLRMDNKIKVMLKKKKEEEWPRIPKVKDQYKQAFKVDWSKMEDEPEEDSDIQKMMRQADMQQMMRGMSNGRGENQKTGFDPSQLPKGFDPSMLPEGFDPSQIQRIDNSDEMRNPLDESESDEEEEEIDTSNFSPEDHLKMQKMAEQIQGDDGEIDMGRFEEMMKGMKMEDFESLMSKLSPEQVKDMIGEEEE
jgi:hypothetical protein